MKTMSCGLAAMIFSLAAGAALADTVRLEVGESRILGSGGTIRTAQIDTAGVVAAQAPSPRELRLTGLKPGHTRLTLVTPGASRTFDIEVVPASAALRRQLHADPRLLGVDAEAHGETVVLSGQAPDLESRAKAESIVQTATGDKVADAVEVGERQVVAVDVRFVAVSDTTLKALGFNFTNLGQGFQWAVISPNTLQSFNFNGSSSSIQTTSPIESAFNIILRDRAKGVTGMLSALSDAGLSQVLAQPTLLVRSGEKADFLAGGDVPVPVPQSGASNGAITVEYRSYGVRLSVEPYVLSSRRIVLKLAPEVSELDYANGVTIQGFSVPGFRRRSANTTVELGDGQSFVIAGLTYSAGTNNESRVPGLGELPVLGALFKRAQRSREKLELVIVATPRIVAPLEPAELGDLAAVGQPAAPAMTDIVMNRATAEQGAAQYGLSR